MKFGQFMATVLITGGTGFIGKALTKALVHENYEVIILTRKIPIRKGDEPSFNSHVSYSIWNTEEQLIDREAIEKADYIIHLAGENVGDRRWTAKRKKLIAGSRILAGALLVKALKENVNHVKAVISASGIGWYGSADFSSPPAEIKQHHPSHSFRRDRPRVVHSHFTPIVEDHPASFIESDPAAEDFLGQTCKQWEESIDPVASLGKRLVKFRAGIVLSQEGGVLDRFRKPLKFGIATILGNGKQVISWIHLDDLVRLYIYAIKNEKIEGVYNAVAPHPVTNKKFVLQLARSMRGRFFIPVYVPGFILRTVFGERSIEVLKSAMVSCEKIRGTGFTFLHPSITSAIHKPVAS